VTQWHWHDVNLLTGVDWCNAAAAAAAAAAIELGLTAPSSLNAPTQCTYVHRARKKNVTVTPFNRI